MRLLENCMMACSRVSKPKYSLAKFDSNKRNTPRSYHDSLHRSDPSSYIPPPPNMPRSPAEATRFTSTGPHAGSKNIGSTISLSTPPPPNETPIQKVARLREAARRAKIDQETTWDRVVSRGRVWADRAHRVTASVLIGSSSMSYDLYIGASHEVSFENT